MHRLFFTFLLLLVAIAPSAAQAPNAQVLPDANLRLREQPNLNADTITILGGGTPLNVVGRTAGGGWLQVITGDQYAGWVFSDYVAMFAPLDAVPVTLESRNDAENLLSLRTVTRITEIYQQGQLLGNRPAMFAKVGDSITASLHSLHPIGESLYTLGKYDALFGVIDFYLHGETPNAFSRQSLAAGVGWTSGALLDPKYADPTLCLAGETPLQCEYRITKPAVAVIMIGTNDVSFYAMQTYRNNISRIVELSIDAGVIPILSTLPPRTGYEAEVAAFNLQIREVADQFAIPLWDFYATMTALPNNGLSPDGVHPSMGTLGYLSAADFRDHNLHAGYVMRNLNTLQFLDAIWQAVIVPQMQEDEQMPTEN